MKTLLLAVCFALSFAHVAPAQSTPVQDVLQAHRALIEKSSRRTIGPAIDALVASGLPQMQNVLEVWQAKEMWQRKADGLFFAAIKNDDGLYLLKRFEDGAQIGTAASTDLKQLKPNSGVRADDCHRLGAIPTFGSRPCQTGRCAGFDCPRPRSRRC